MYYKHNKGLFLVQYITQKLVKNRSQNIVNYILKMVWLCAADWHILNATESWNWKRNVNSRLPTTVVIHTDVLQCPSQIFIFIFFRRQLARPALLHLGNQRGEWSFLPSPPKEKGLKCDRNYMGCPWTQNWRGPFFFLSPNLTTEIKMVSIATTASQIFCILQVHLFTF